MANVIDGEPANFMVHFLHSANPRHGFWVMSTKPHVHYEFLTPPGLPTTHTMVTTNNGMNVARFDWIGPSAPGTVTWLGPPVRQAHMGDLTMAFPHMEHSRAFRCRGPDQEMRTFWWHRLRRNDGHSDYELYAADQPEDVRIGLFTQHEEPEVLNVGINYATFYFGFWHEPLLLHALLALSLNRWFDSQGWQ